MTKKMKIGLVVCGALIALVPLAVNAAITGTKHDLSFTSGQATAKAVSETQICVFCHTPHQAMSQSLLWNHAAGTVSGFSAGQTTLGGTTLPAALNNGVSKKCLGCHDGTIGVGDAPTTGAIAMSGADLDSSGKILPTLNTRVGNGTSIDNNHPVGIPYPGQPAYNGITTTVTTGAGTYKTLASAQTAGLKFYSNALPGDTGLGVECASCHDVHGATGIASFLRIANTGSALCLTCHDK